MLIPCIFLLNRGKPVEKKQSRRDLLIGGMLCGFFLAAASSFQQFGILYTSVGKAGFITALYILLVPLLGMIFGKRVSGKVWLAVGIAVVGMYLLCVTEGFTIAFGDMLVMVGALLFAVHILVIDHFSPRADGVMLSCIQFFTCGVLCSVGMLIFEQLSLTQILDAWLPILYAGVMSCGVAYTCQIIGQRDTDPTIASLILSLESVVSVLAGLCSARLFWRSCRRSSADSDALAQRSSRSSSASFARAFFSMRDIYEREIPSFFAISRWVTASPPYRP